jgi:hypothetical protein
MKEKRIYGLWQFSKKRPVTKNIVGWAAVIITVIIASTWTYWGIIENFHEGWYSESILENLGMLIFQYLSIPIIFIVLSVISIRWPKAGLALYTGTGLFCAWFFSGASFQVLGLMIILPLIGIGLMYFLGRPEPKKWAYRIIILFPLVIILAVTSFKIVQLGQRVNDGNFAIRYVDGNGVRLAWAPRGPGWPDEGVTYYEALDRCRYLSEDGTTLMHEEQNIWRLPTVDEAVQSMTLHNENSGGSWDPVRREATYKKIPDKETPLWDPHSSIIYYWVLSDEESERGNIIVYNGGVFDRIKNRKYGYLSFRAVKDSYE